MLFGNVIFFRGCMIRGVYPEIGDRWIRILRKLGINAVVLPEERCCGSPLKNAGALDEYERNASLLTRIIRKYHGKEVIAACPACAHTLSELLTIPVKHVVQAVLPRLKKARLENVGMRVVFHDPCHLSRYVGAVEEPREIIRACGCELLEPTLYGRFTYCCGGGGGLPANHPGVAERVGRERVKQLEDTGADAIVTSCPMCIHQLKRYSSIPVIDLSVILAKALGV